MPNKKKYITTTLPYANSHPHIGHTFEFVLADLISSYFKYKLGSSNVVFNLGVDEYGQKIYQKSKEEGFASTQDFCDKYAQVWKDFCSDFNIEYDNFYRTTSETHKKHVNSFYELIEKDLYTKNYSGKYCVGCESFVLQRDVESTNICPTHKTELIDLEEENIFFNLKKYAHLIQDTLVDKSLSNELANLLKDDYDLSITRKNVVWGVQYKNGDVFYVWAEALINYLSAAGYFDDTKKFEDLWSDSIQICGKDNLKFQSYIFPALCVAANIPQIKSVLVHGIILDEKGQKMSKSIGNVIDPVTQKDKYGIMPLRYYLAFGLNTFKDSKYSEKDLAETWNSDIVNGLGNTISRTLHLLDKKGVNPDYDNLSTVFKEKLSLEYQNIDNAFTLYDFHGVRLNLIKVIKEINERFNNEKPFDKDCVNYEEILNQLYFQLKNVIPFYKIILKEKSNELDAAFENNKKVILFEKI